MTRRSILTTIELILTTSALTAATYALINAAYNPAAAVQWVPVVTMGIGTAAVIVAVAALLFAGRAGLLLAVDAAEAIRRHRAVREAKERLATQAGSGHHRSAGRAPTLRFTAEELATRGYGPAGGGR